MNTDVLTRRSETTPTLFDDFFKPLNEWLGNSGFFGPVMNIPAINITEEKNDYRVSMAVPGLKKEDLKIDVSGNILTISSEKETNQEDNDKKFTRKEYNYSSFSRSLTLPDEINKEKIEAKYEDGLLKIVLPRKQEAITAATKQIAVD